MSISDRLDEIEARTVRAREGRQIDRYMVLDVDAPAMLAALRAVLDRHKPYPDTGMGWRDDNTYGYVGAVCDACGTPDEYGAPWPCSTVRAVQAALGEGS